MQISQADFRTVHIRKDGLSFFLRYNLYQDGEERYPESINCREDTVVAYFLTSTIRDFIRETAWGFSVERSWKIVPEGQFALTFCLDLPEPAPYSLLLPGAAASSGAGLPARGLAAPGQDTAIPNGAYLLGGSQSVLVFSDPPRGTSGPGGVSGRRVTADEERMLRTEIRLPGLPPAESEDTPRLSRAARPSRRKVQPLPGYFPAGGDYENTLRFNVVAAATDRVFHRGIEAALERLGNQAHRRWSPQSRAVRSLVESSIQDCLDGHLVQAKGVHGLRSVPGGTDLSSAAGVDLANLLVELFPEDDVMVETALRLADFALKGQHPGGLFYGTYRLREESWLPPGAGPESPPQIQTGETARIACSLVRLAERLQAAGRPGNRYLMAGERVGEALLGSRADLAEVAAELHPDSLLSVGDKGEAIALIELFLQLHRRSGRDAHKKAVAALVRRFYGEAPEPYAAALVGLAERQGGAGDPAAPGPGSEAGGGSEPGEPSLPCCRLSLEGALRQARIAALLLESGYKPRGPEEYLGRLLPWVCLNPRLLPEKLSMVGAAVGELGTGRVLFRGFELAYTLLRLERCLGKAKGPGIIDAAVTQLVGFTLQKPIGTSWLAMDPAAKVSSGPVDSRILVREVDALMRLGEQFPAVLG